MVYCSLHLSTFLLFTVTTGVGLVDGVLYWRIPNGKNTSLVHMLRFLRYANKEMTKAAEKSVLADFNYATDLSMENDKAHRKAREEKSDVRRKLREGAKAFAWQNFKKNDFRYRLFKSYCIIGTDILPKSKLRKFNDVSDRLDRNFSTTTVHLLNCKKKQCYLPDLKNIMATSHNVENLTNVWQAWRDAIGPKLKCGFFTSVKLYNEAAKLNGFRSAWEMWEEPYEDPCFWKTMEKLFDAIRPFYEQLHAYTRSKLSKKYKGHIKKDGPIPAQLLGTMCADKWTNVFPLVKPYPEKSTPNITKSLNRKNYTPHKMIELAEKFYVSLGLEKLTPEFWRGSVIQKKKGVKMKCFPESIDTFTKNDVRLIMCMNVNMDDQFTVYRELGNIQQFLQYQDQPYPLRDSANPGFREAIGDTIMRFTKNPKFLKEQGLLKKYDGDKKDDINFLLLESLDRFVHMPYAFTVDYWRSKVFKGEYSSSEANTKWWDARLKYQGVCPPVQRTENDFDPTSKYHVARFVEYIRHFISCVLEFQFFEALCNECGHTGQLHQCNIYNCTKAGDLLRQVMKKGSSQPWRKTLGIMTKKKTSELDVSSLLRYYQPLIDWLKEQNKNEHIGWLSLDSTACP